MADQNEHEHDGKVNSGITFPDRDDTNTGYKANLTPQQKEVLEALKERMKTTTYQKDLEQNPDGDRFVLRYLRATMKSKRKDRIFDLEEGEKRLVEALEYRRKYKVDEEIRPNVEKGTLPEEYIRYRDVIRPRVMFVEPRTGRIVHVERFGLLLTHTNVDEYSMDDWIRYFIYDLETKLMILREESKKRGYEVSMQVAIFDQRGVGMGALKRLSLFKALSHLAGIVYPEFMGPIFVLNIHWMFAKGFAVVKPFMDPVTLSKVIIDSAVPIDKITAYLPRELLPKEYGGTNEAVVGVPLHAKDKA